MTDLPAYLQPFVLPVPAPAAQRVDRVDNLDFYRPSTSTRVAAILFVHGGPGPPDLEVQPRDWPVYQGYAAAAAARGLVGVTLDHRLIRGLDQLAAAADDVEAAVGLLRADPQVDPNRIALWFFSGAGLLAGEWLDSRPEWLRCVALTYPMLAAPPGVDELVSAVEVIGKHPDLPVLLTRVGLERAELAEPVAEFVTAAGPGLDVIDVPKGRHGFDMLDHTDESRAAVTKALDWTAHHLGGSSEDRGSRVPQVSQITATEAKPATGKPPTGKPSKAQPAAATNPAAPANPAAATKSAVATKPAAATEPAVATRPAAATKPAVAAKPDATAELPDSGPGRAATREQSSTGPTAQPKSAAPAAAPAASSAAKAPAASQEGPAGQAGPPVAADTPAAQVVAREHAAYNAQDLEAFLAMYSPTARLQLADGTVKRGRRELREHYGPAFATGRLKLELTGRLAVGDWIVDQSLLQRSKGGPAPAIALYRVQDGAIVEVRFLH